jgi:hypothetical protein
MAFLDFLKPKGNGKTRPPADQRTDLDAALAKIAQERAAVQLVLDGLESRREGLLLADAPDGDIAALDKEGDSARVRLEKLDVFEVEVHAKLSDLEGIEAEVEWRRLFDARHAAACDFASSFNETCGRMFALRAATNAASASSIGRKFGLLTEPPPLILSGESLQKFLRETEMMSDLESRLVRRSSGVKSWKTEPGSVVIPGRSGRAGCGLWRRPAGPRRSFGGSSRDVAMFL